MKVVVNRCEEGGFNLSPLAVRRYLQYRGYDCYAYKQTKFVCKDGIKEYERVWLSDVSSSFPNYSITDLGKTVNEFPEKTVIKVFKIKRTDQCLIKVVEEMGESANTEFSKLEVIEIPDDIEWYIENKNGYEVIHEKHRSW